MISTMISNDMLIIQGEAGRRKSLKQEERLAVSQNKSHRDPTKVPDRDIVLGRDSCFQPGSDEEFPPDSEVEQDDLDVLQSKLASPQQWAFQLASMGALETDPDYGLDVLELSKAGRKKSKKKQKQVGLDLNISDSELEFELEKAWAKDRGKKKVKKQKREELRSQGLLGRGVGKPDLKTKYSNGMDLEDFKQETKRFLLSPKNRCVSTLYSNEMVVAPSSPTHLVYLCPR